MNQKTLERVIIAGSVAAVLFLLSLAALGGAFLLVLNGYGSGV